MTIFPKPAWDFDAVPYLFKVESSSTRHALRSGNIFPPHDKTYYFMSCIIMRQKCCHSWLQTELTSLSCQTKQETFWWPDPAAISKFRIRVFIKKHFLGYVRRFLSADFMRGKLNLTHCKLLSCFKQQKITLSL